MKGDPLRNFFRRKVSQCRKKLKGGAFSFARYCMLHFLRTILASSGKKSHYYSRVSLHEALTKKLNCLGDKRGSPHSGIGGVQNSGSVGLQIEVVVDYSSSPSTPQLSPLFLPPPPRCRPTHWAQRGATAAVATPTLSM